MIAIYFLSRLVTTSCHLVPWDDAPQWRFLLCRTISTLSVWTICFSCFSCHTSCHLGPLVAHQW